MPFQAGRLRVAHTIAAHRHTCVPIAAHRHMSLMYCCLSDLLAWRDGGTDTFQRLIYREHALMSVYCLPTWRRSHHNRTVGSLLVV